MMIKTLLVASTKSILLVLIGVLGSAQSIAATGVRDQGGQSASAAFIYGVMNGVKLQIPRNYVFGPVVHNGESRFDGHEAGDNGKETPEIDVFGILLRISNLQPIATEQDQRDWSFDRRQTSFMKSWVMISFDKQYRLNLNKSGPDMISAWGPYVSDKIPQFGLMHFESRQSVDDGARDMYGHVEYFYDKSTDTTILCHTLRKRVPPYDTFDTCQQFFLIPRLRVMAGATSTKKDIFRWREIEKKVIDLVDEFSQK